MDFSWAKEYSELHKICTLFQLSEVSNPVKFKYRSLPSYLQEGPQCGLVALAMFMKTCTKEIVQLIFETAKENQFTYNGEMFSAQDMLNLAQKLIPNKKPKLYSGRIDCNEIKNFLLGGGNMLIPYDTDKDNSPGIYRGHKAHWAAISGAIQSKDDFFVIARHGKARNVAIWKLKDLAESNAQLFEFSPDRKMQDLEYKLPTGGINGELGLNCKSVLID